MRLGGLGHRTAWDSPTEVILAAKAHAPAEAPPRRKTEGGPTDIRWQYGGGTGFEPMARDRLASGL